MRKVIKILAKIVSAIILLLIFLPISATLLLNIDRVQNYIIDHASNYASEFLDSHVSVGSIKIDLLTKVHVHDFYVESPERDTLLYVKEVEAYIGSLNIPQDGLCLRDVEIVGAELNLREMENGDLTIHPIVKRLTKPNHHSNFCMYVNKVEISESRFRYERLEHRDPEYGIDYYNMVVGDIEGKLQNFAIEQGAVAATINELSAREKSGFELGNLTGNFYINRGVIRFGSIIANTEQSLINIPSFIIDGQNWEEYKQYIDLVEMRGVVTNSRLSTFDLGFFAPNLRNWELMADSLQGSFEGTVADFTATIESGNLGEHTSIAGEAHIIGIPLWQESDYKVKVDRLYTTASDVENFVYRTTGNHLPEKAQEIVRNLATADVRGTFNGKLYSFRTLGNIRTSQGNISADVDMRRVDGEHHMLSGSVDTDNLHLGKILEINLLGTLDSKISARGLVGGNNVKGSINASVGKMVLGGKPFREITASAKIGETSRDTLKVSSPRPELNFNFLGSVNRRGHKPFYDFDLELRNADLHALGINQRDSISRLSLTVAGEKISGNTIDDLDGTVTLSDIRYLYASEELETDKLIIKVHGNKLPRKIDLSSDFMEVKFTSTCGYKELQSYLPNILRDYIPSLYSSEVPRNSYTPSNKHNISSLKINAQSRINDLLYAIAPDLYIAPNTDLEATLVHESNSIDLRLDSEGMDFRGFIIDSMSVNIFNTPYSLSAKEDNNKFKLHFNSRATYLRSQPLFPRLDITGEIYNNQIDLEATLSENKGVLGFTTYVSRNPQTHRRTLRIDISPSYINAGNRQWRLMSKSINIDSSRVHVNDFRIKSNDEELRLNGIASANRQDTIHLELTNFDLSPLSELIAHIGYNFAAKSNGYATLRSALRKPQLEARINLTDITVNGIEAPPQLLTSDCDFAQNHARVTMSDYASGNTIAEGIYRPDDKRYNVRAQMQELPLSLMQPFLVDIISDIRGSARDIDVRLTGQGRQAVLSGSATIDGLDVHVDYTNTRYSAPRGKVTIANNIIAANEISVFDSEGHEGFFTMNIDLNKLSKVRYDIGIEARNMLVFDTNEELNDLFYGRIHASGTAKFSNKDMDQGMKMIINAYSEPNSTFYMPLTGTEDISYADYVSFKQPAKRQVESVGYIASRINTYARASRFSDSSDSNMDIDIALNISPNIEMQLITDPDSGDVIKGKGSGEINMHIEPHTDKFEMTGTYTLSEGTYRFSLVDIVTKLFEVENGSTIKWSGDPLGAELNIKAIYKTKASLKPLLGSSVPGVDTSRSADVDCYIILTGDLMSPDVNFDVKVTKVSPEIQSIVNSMLVDQQSISTQMVSLLTANTFSADELGALTSIVTTTGLEFASSYLSRMLLGDNFDLNVRYLPGAGSNELDLGFSTGLLNNRLQLEVDSGYINDQTQQQVRFNNFLVDAYITYLFDADGTFRVYGFTQTTDRYDENQGEQEGGIGLSINASFNTLNELWTNIVGSKEVRMERRTERRAHKDSLKRAHTEPRNVELQDTTRRVDSLINIEMIEIEEKEIVKGSSKMRELSVDSDRVELPNEDQD